MSERRSIALPESPVLWVVTADDRSRDEATRELSPAGYTTVAVHWDELEEVEGPAPDLLLVDLPEGEAVGKGLEALKGCAAAAAPCLVVVQRAGQADGLEGGTLPPADFVVAEAGVWPWAEVTARLRLLLADHRARTLERDLAECAGALSGASTWSLDLQAGRFVCSAGLAAQLGGQRCWEGPHCAELCSRIGSRELDELKRAVARVAKEGGTLAFEQRFETASGEPRHVLHRLQRARWGKGTIVGALLDVTEERISTERLQRLAHYDSLTGLVTRHHFLTQLGEALRRGSLRPTASLLFIDLDGLKRVNDTMGHRGGDLLLRQSAERLRLGLRRAPEIHQVVDEDRRPVLGRMGGDEFTVLLPGVPEEDAHAVAEALVQGFREPFEISGKRLMATASIGVTTAGAELAEADELVRHADAAMYEAKRRGGDRWELYRPELDRHQSRRQDVKDRLREALANGELELHYQPRVHLRSGRIAGAEALMRWTSPALGRVSPGEFIPIAEETGMIQVVGDFAIERACEDLRRFDAAGLTELRVSVNVSGVQLMQPGYASRLFAALQMANADPRRIELEVTESVTLFGLQDVAGLLREIRSTGVYVALDDFGTGYSSLGVLLQLPLDCLKLDQSLIRDLHLNPDAASVVRAMIVMAHSLGLSVVAEGVTEEVQEDLLRDLECDEIQGFRFAPPLPVEDFVRKAQEHLLR